MDLKLNFDFPTNSQQLVYNLSKRKEGDKKEGDEKEGDEKEGDEKEPEKKSQEANHNVCIFPNYFPVLVK